MRRCLSPRPAARIESSTAACSPLDVETSAKACTIRSTPYVVLGYPQNGRAYSYEQCQQFVRSTPGIFIPPCVIPAPLQLIACAVSVNLGHPIP